MMTSAGLRGCGLWQLEPDAICTTFMKEIVQAFPSSSFKNEECVQDITDFKLLEFSADEGNCDPDTLEGDVNTEYVSQLLDIYF